MELINKKLLGEEKIKEFRKKFFDGKPFEHLLLRDFLEEKRAKKVLEALKKEKFEHKECDLFSLSQTNDLKYSKNKVLQEFYRLMVSKEFAKWIEEITGISLNREKIDMSGSLYEECDYLLCHDDQLEGRKIAFIYYLSSDFSEKEGGAFVMFDCENGQAGGIAKRYSPRLNSFLIFIVSDKSFHEVEENMSNKDRYAIGGWLH